MPADFHIDTQHGVVYAKATGVFSHAEVLAYRARLLSHPDFRPGLNELADYREVAKMALSSAEVEELARDTIYSAHSKRAFVVASDLQFGLSRMFGAYRKIAGDQEIMVFRTMAEALSWLPLPAAPDPKLFKLLNPPVNEA
ncbi:MAG TPA: hypothetical protein VNW23_05215 [Opitutaceae bacterium]|nr:hypothetical protein [Opitutaceae bacterium]